MTKDEAIQAMQEGKKVTHDFFMPHEWVMIDKNGAVVYEDGNTTSLREFSALRVGYYWLSGWSLYNEKNK
ncbi:MAG: hypothetical protein KF900_14050 [Bacteroidetes bacterium]|nr:hypothetical protein [Bacteroidota bacterium]